MKVNRSSLGRSQKLIIEERGCLVIQSNGCQEKFKKKVIFIPILIEALGYRNLGLASF
jgi:hypothetical protein